MAHKIDRRAIVAGLFAALGGGTAWAQAARYGTLDRRESQYATTYIDRDGDYIAMTFGINDCLSPRASTIPTTPPNFQWLIRAR